jgi:hypothetical protein
MQQAEACFTVFSTLAGLTGIEAATTQDVRARHSTPQTPQAFRHV